MRQEIGYISANSIKVEKYKENSKKIGNNCN